MKVRKEEIFESDYEAQKTLLQQQIFRYSQNYLSEPNGQSITKVNAVRDRDVLRKIPRVH